MDSIIWWKKIIKWGKKGNDLHEKESDSINSGKALIRSILEGNKSFIGPHEMDSYEYAQANEKDNRKLLSMFISSLFKRESVIFSFINERNISII